MLEKLFLTLYKNPIGPFSYFSPSPSVSFFSFSLKT